MIAILAVLAFAFLIVGFGLSVALTIRRCKQRNNEFRHLSLASNACVLLGIISFMIVLLGSITGGTGFFAKHGGDPTAKPAMTTVFISSDENDPIVFRIPPDLDVDLIDDRMTLARSFAQEVLTKAYAQYQNADNRTGKPPINADVEHEQLPIVVGTDGMSDPIVLIGGGTKWMIQFRLAFDDLLRADPTVGKIRIKEQSLRPAGNPTWKHLQDYEAYAQKEAENFTEILQKVARSVAADSKNIEIDG